MVVWRLHLITSWASPSYITSGGWGLSKCHSSLTLRSLRSCKTRPWATYSAYKDNVIREILPAYSLNSMQSWIPQNFNGLFDGGTGILMFDTGEPTAMPFLSGQTGLDISMVPTKAFFGGASWTIATIFSPSNRYDVTFHRPSACAAS